MKVVISRWVRNEICEFGVTESGALTPVNHPAVRVSGTVKEVILPLCARREGS
jgi:hypothetical protein